MQSIAAMHEKDPDDTLIQMRPREGEETLRTEDILKVIREQGDSIAVIIFSGLQYYSGMKLYLTKLHIFPD